MSRDDGSYKEWAWCKRKKRFADEHRAVRRAGQLGLRVYGCSNCHGWHLTKMPLTTRSYASVTMREPTTLEAAQRRLTEAQRILTKLTALQKTGVELPLSTLTLAQTRVDEAKDAIDELRSPKKMP